MKKNEKNIYISHGLFVISKTKILDRVNQIQKTTIRFWSNETIKVMAIPKLLNLCLTKQDRARIYICANSTNVVNVCFGFYTLIRAIFDSKEIV